MNDPRRRPATVLAALLALSSLALSACGPDHPRNAVLIVLDTLRADRLSAYGYPVRTSPVLDELADEGVLFETAVSNASWTLPAMVGLMAGDFPTEKLFGPELNHSLVEVIRGAGVRTAAFVEGGFVSAHYGFDRGFDDFHDGSSGRKRGANPYDGHSVVIEETFRAAGDWLRQNHEQPFFLLVHTYEPHTPYTRMDYTGGLDSGVLGETFEVIDAAKIRKGMTTFGDTERTYVRALYDGGVTASDRQVGQLLDLLEELGRRDDTAIIVTSDHGEDIGGREPEWPGVHGHNLYDELILVPLIIHDPTRDYKVKRVSAQVRTIDTLHSIIDLLGIPSPGGLHGKSLVPLMTGEETDDRYAYAKIRRVPYFDFEERYAIRTGTHKLIMTPGERGDFRSELYDLRSDPGERVSIDTKQPGRRAQLQNLLIGLRDSLHADGVTQYSIKKAHTRESDVQERLRELGYIE